MSSEQLDKIMEQIQRQKDENERKEKETEVQNDKPKLSPLEETLQEIRQKDAELQAQEDEQERKFVKVTTGQDIVVYPKENVSLDEFRRDEAARVNRFGKNSAFVDLFEDRLDNMPGERMNISITVHVTITTGLIEENRTFGPFEMEIPELDKNDMYKFMMYTLLVNNFTTLSGQVISKVGAKVLTHNKQYFAQHFMEGVKLENHLLSKHRKIKSHGNTTCVQDFIWDQVKGQRGFKTYTYKKLAKEVNSYATIDIIGQLAPKLNTENLIMWAKECHPNVSIHAFDSTYRKFVTHTNNCSNISLVYIVKDHHCFPITKEDLKKVAAKANQGGTSNLLKYMAELKWSRRNENVCKLEFFNDVATLKRENAVVILPEEAKMPVAVKKYVEKSNYYVEHLHWNNNGILDGFMDEKKQHLPAE